MFPDFDLLKNATNFDYWYAVEKDLTGVDLSGKSFSYATFKKFILQGVNFTGTDLTGANFEEAYLRAANFTNADLRGAVFTGANLLNANFTGADLRRVTMVNTKNFKTADFNGCKMDFGLKCKIVYFSACNFCKRFYNN